MGIPKLSSPGYPPLAQAEHQAEHHTEHHTENPHPALPIPSPAHRRRSSVLLSAAALALLLCLGIGLATGLFAGCRIATSGIAKPGALSLSETVHVTNPEKIPCVPHDASATATTIHSSVRVQEGEGVQDVLDQKLNRELDGTQDGDQESYQAKPCPCPPASSTSSVPQYFQTSPGLWAGPTATGRAPFLAQTRAWEGEYVPNAPLQTQVPFRGDIFGGMGHLSPYVPSPGFGVDEFPLPRGADIVQVQMLSRHGSRYPTVGANVASLGGRIAKAKSKKDKAHFSHALEFLNDWKYELGYETLVPKGRQELFDSGVLHAYMYSQLYNPNSKIIVRTTTQDRMLKSAEYFLAGFFGLQWTRNATIEVIIEESGFNNSLCGDLNCPNADKNNGGWDAANKWISKYLQNATDRLGSMAEGFDWTLEDTYAAQNMCPYETVAYGYSRFCELFTYDEWVGFGYSIDLAFYGGFSFGSPLGRAVGIGYQQEVMARLKNHTLGYSGSQINVTLDNNTITFPLNQSLYLDFSHDTTVAATLTAFGLTQFAEPLDPSAHPGKHNFTISHVTPFAARLDIEIIRAPKPLAANRSGYLDGGETKYVHFVLNQRTIPLGWSIPECDNSRIDGWCEFDAFLRAQERMPGLAKFELACFGDLEIGPYGTYTDGAP